MTPQPTPPTAPKALNVEEAAKQLSVSPWMVRSAIRKGELRAKRFGSRWLIPVDAIDEFLNDEVAS